MPLLQVRNCPEDLRARLGQAATLDRRSVAKETIILLEEALAARDSQRRARRAAAFDLLTSDAASSSAMTLDPVALIRQDRDR